jgi:hypothetical protein
MRYHGKDPTHASGGASAAPECEAQARAAHSYFTQLALRQGAAGTFYLSFVGAAQGAFYGVIAGGGSGASKGAWIGAAAGAGLGLVLGTIEGVGRALVARAAYESALAHCGTAAPAPPAVAPPASTEEAPPAAKTVALPD